MVLLNLFAYQFYLDGDLADNMTVAWESVEEELENISIHGYWESKGWLGELPELTRTGVSGGVPQKAI